MLNVVTASSSELNLVSVNGLIILSIKGTYSLWNTANNSSFLASFVLSETSNSGFVWVEQWFDEFYQTRVIQMDMYVSHGFSGNIEVCSSSSGASVLELNALYLHNTGFPSIELLLPS